MSFTLSIEDLLFLRPSIVSKWRGLRGVGVHLPLPDVLEVEDRKPALRAVVPGDARGGGGVRPDG